MHKIIIAFTLFVITFGSTQAQFFNISNINTDEFPWVSTVFVAKDQNNDFIKSATVDQFSIEEDGIFIPNSKMEIECFENQDIPELSIVIVVDKSGSMKIPFTADKPDDTPWFRVYQGVEAFLSTIKFVGRTKAALVSFSNDSYLNCPFTNNPDEILDSLKGIDPSGSTRYDPPYIKDEYVQNGDIKKESAVALLKDRPAEIKKIVVFLTDGEPSVPPSTLKIIDSLRYYNISAYNISFLTDLNDDLNEISNSTNGRAYRVEKKEDLTHIYTEIAIDAQKAYFCKLSWLSEYPCYESQRDRFVDITFKGVNPYGRGSRNYVVPEQYIPKRNWDKKTYSFGNPEVGPNNSVIKTIKLAIDNVDFNLDNLEITPSGQGFKIISVLDKSGKPITNKSTVKEGDTIFVNVEFEQFGTKTLRTATLTANGTPCLTAAELVGGTTDIILETPVGGEVYTTCDNIDVLWSGVEPNTQVHISYSNDDFKKDSIFIATTTNNGYNWNKLPAPGDYKIRLRVDPVARYIFAINDQTDGRSYGSSIELSRDELFVYSCGNYNDSVKFESTVLKNSGNEDIFLAKHNSAGKLIWANSLGGDGLDSAAGVCVDDQEQVFITGATTKGGKFGTTTVTSTLPGSVFYVAKTSATGGSYVVRTIEAKSPYIDFEAWGTKIRYDEATQQIVVQGGFKNNYEYVTPKKTYSFKGSGRFTAYYDKNLNFVDLIFGALAGDYSDNKAVTKDGRSTYEIGTMNADKTFGNFKLKHNGNNDFYITRFGLNEPSEATSTKSFTIEKPTLKYSQAGPVIFNDTPINDVDNKHIPKFVINTSILPINIESVSITGPNKTEFNLDKSFEGFIDSGVDNAKEIFIDFNPQTIGPKTATLNIKGVCSDVISIELKGNGICDLVSTPEINFGASNLNIATNKTDTQIFTNNNNVPIRITPRITNDVDNEFKIVSINNDVNLVGTSINVGAKTSIEIALSFTPIKEGNKTAKLVFNPETAGCSDISTNLVGIGANTDLSYAVVDFGRKRIKTVNTLNLEIMNSGKLPVKLTSINLNNNDAFKLNLPNDLTVKTTEPLIIPITFNPQIDGNYSEPINIVINPGDSPISLNNVIGIGENPTAIGTLDCKGGGIQNTKSIVDLILTNNSKVALTKVQNLAISANSNYTFVGGSKVLAVVPDIAINNFISIPLEFTPTIAGINNLDLTVISETEVGNNVDDKVNDPKTETTTISCSAVEAEGDIPVIFSGVLVCDTYSKQISIINQNPTDARGILSYNLTPSGTDFSISKLSVPTSIDAGGKLDFNINFSPTFVGVQNAVLKINFDDGLTNTYNITGTGKRIRYFTNDDKLNVLPGSDINLKLMADIPVLDYPIQNLDITIEHNPDVTSFETNQNGFIIVPVSNSINWTWNKTGNKNSQQYIDFNGIANNPASYLNNGVVELFAIKYFMYLGPTVDDNIEIADFDCTNKEFSKVQNVKLSGVCALDKRLITIGIAPEPSNSQFIRNINMIRTEFTVMYDDLDVNVELFDINGNIVKSNLISNLNQGRYESVMDVSNISSGLYFIRTISGVHNDTQKLMIIK